MSEKRGGGWFEGWPYGRGKISEREKERDSKTGSRTERVRKR